MTKEELEKEAEEYTKNLLKKLGIKEDMLLENQPKYLRQGSINFVALDVENVTEAYLVGAKPREKRIKHLEDSLLDVTEKSVKKIADLEEKLANADYQLEGRDVTIKELEAQIEKMKCCGNCAKRGHICVAEEMQGNLCGKNKDKWELRR